MTFIPAFTDWDELGKWSKEKEQTLICTYEDLETMVTQSKDTIKGFAINPFGQNFVITPEVMEYFSKRKSGAVQKHDNE